MSTIFKKTLLKSSILASVLSNFFSNLASSMPTATVLTRNDTLIYPPLQQTHELLPVSKNNRYSESLWNDALNVWKSYPNQDQLTKARSEYDKLTSGFTCQAPTFSCTGYPDDGVAPKDAQHVRPKDITTVMALGDSITAGLFMDSSSFPFTLLREFRGASFVIGGDDGETTIPNMLKTYNRNEIGASTGHTILKSTHDNMNAAISGETSSNLVSQIDTLISTFNQGPYKTANEGGWNMVGLLIGANDACSICKDPKTYSPQNFEMNYRAAIEKLRLNFPNTIVNAYPVFKPAQVYFAEQESTYCKLVHDIVSECECMYTPENRAMMDDAITAYNEIIYKVASSYTVDKYPNFAVHVQPGFQDLTLTEMKAGPAAGLNWLSKLDCYHPNTCANRAAAGMMWNNMFQREGEKKRYQFESFVENEKLFCPGPNDYLQ